MPDGPGRFTQDYTCPALLRMTHATTLVRVRGFHPLRPYVPVRSTLIDFAFGVLLQPLQGA